MAHYFLMNNDNDMLEKEKKIKIFYKRHYCYYLLINLFLIIHDWAGGGNCFREKLKRQRASASGREFVFVINHTHPRTQRKTNGGPAHFLIKMN